VTTHAPVQSTPRSDDPRARRSGGRPGRRATTSRCVLRTAWSATCTPTAARERRGCSAWWT